MALNIQNLQNLSGSKGPKVWTYETTDNRAAATGAGYFNGAYDHLSIGDLLWIVSSDHKFLATVSAKSAGAITVAAPSTFAA